MNNTREGGFTLLEVLVTLVLISIIASFAVLSIPGNDSRERLADEARRLAALLEMTRQEALLRGEQRGVYFTATGYTLMTLDGKGPVLSLNNAVAQHEYPLPAGFQLQLWIEGRPVTFARNPDYLPQVLLLSSGEMTAFTVVLSEVEGNRYDKKGYQVAGDLTGRLQVEPVK